MTISFPPFLFSFFFFPRLFFGIFTHRAHSQYRFEQRRGLSFVRELHIFPLDTRRFYYYAIRREFPFFFFLLLSLTNLFFANRASSIGGDEG